MPVGCVGFCVSCVCFLFSFWFDNSLEFVLDVNCVLLAAWFVWTSLSIVVLMFVSGRLQNAWCSVAFLNTHRTHQIKRAMFLAVVWCLGFATAFAYIIRVECPMCVGVPVVRVLVCVCVWMV